jgi:hypothetical protein
VEISGPVKVSIAPLITVTMSDLAVGQPGTVAAARALHMQGAVLSFPMAKLAQGEFELEALSITGLTFELSTAGTKSDAGEMMRETADVIVSVLNSKSAQHVSLHDVSIVRRNDPDGWNGEIEFKEIVPVKNHADGSLSVEADGTFNGSPLAISISIAPMVVGTAGFRKQPLDVAVSVAGATATLKGDLGADGEEMNAVLAIDLTSFGDLLELLRLRREAEGKGHVSMRLSGQFNALKADSIEATMGLESGEQATIGGQIANVTAASGIDLTFDVSLEREGGAGVSVDDAFDLQLEALRGRVSGNTHGLTVDGLVLTTNIASAQFGEIGPVSIQRITRDDEGRVSLVGLSVKNGDPDDLDLDLLGEVKDVLALSGISLAGSFNLDVADLLTGAAASKAAGILRGKLSISDASGSLRVETFSAKTAGDGPLRLALELQPSPKDGSVAPLNVTLEALSLDAVAAAVGATPIGSGGASFKGAIRLDEGIRLSGDAGVGKTSIKVNLRGNIDKGRPVLRGDVKSPHLHLSDLRRAARLASLFHWRSEGVTVDADFAGEFEAEIDIAAAAIDGPKAPTGALTTHLSYRNRTTALAPLRLDFLGGRIEAQLTLTQREKAPSAVLKGTVAKMDLAALLSELELKPMVTGALGAGVDLTATGDTLGALAASLTGGVTASISDGKVGTRLIDLVGQDVVSWVFSGGKGGDTRLVCADARLAFKQGLGKVEKLVIETENVQLVGGGTIDLRDDRLKISFQPRPIRRKILEMATPFVIEGALSSPKVSLKPGAAGSRVVAETVTLPLHLLTALLGGGGAGATNRVPCTINDVPVR